jgi:hypothetical protein
MALRGSGSGGGWELKSSQASRLPTPLRRSGSSHRPQAAMSASMAPCNERLLLPPVLHNLTTPNPLGLSESAVGRMGELERAMHASVAADACG